MDVYKVSRLDKSAKTHPIDPNNPNKFRKNGGGVLIAIRRDMDRILSLLDLNFSVLVKFLE